MTVLEMAKKYCPRTWDKARLDALVAAGRMTAEEEAEVIQGIAAE